MTKDEFISRQETMKHYGHKIALLWLTGFGAFALCSVPFGTYIKQNEWVQSLFAICFLIYFVGGIVFISLLNRRNQKKLGIICPNCAKPLFRTSAKSIIATGKCGRCGEKIING
ncbi:MAG TPA: hypothetical protein VNZ25_03695 [Candidatus Angelobacter sp.]|nr:hypothetical protein [Candidatus Angelobacter sp.]